MATNKNTIKSWFLTNLFPTQAQFHAWLDSFWHKDENIPQNNIEGLQDSLDDKMDIEALHPIAITGDYNDLEGKPLINDQRMILRKPGNTGPLPKLGDRVKGFVAGKYIEDGECIVDGGDPNDLDTWNITQSDDIEDID